MSLLMDALRKAEEAKKKAAQEAKSEAVTAPPVVDEQQESAAAEKTVDVAAVSPPAATEFSMADMEDVPTSSATPNLETPIEFEDEEDSVLTSSVGSTAMSAEEAVPGEQEAELEPEPKIEIRSLADLEPEPEIEIRSLADLAPEPEIEIRSLADLEPEPEIEIRSLADLESESARETESVADFGIDAEAEVETGSKSEIETEAILKGWDAAESDAGSDSAAAEDSSATPEPIGLDDLEEEGEDHSEDSAEQEMPSTVSAEARKSAVEESVVEPGKLGRARSNAKEGPRQKTARNVFAAKQLPAATKRRIQVAAGSGLFLLLVAIGTYFYISLNQESTFTIPSGSYVASEYIDDGIDQENDGGEPATDLSDQTQPADVASANAVTVELDSAVAASDASANSSSLEEILSASEFPEVVVPPQPIPNSAAIEPEAQVEESTPLATVATTIGDALSPSPEPNSSPSPSPSSNSSPSPEAVANAEPTQPALNEPAEPATSAEPTNLISFRRQENVTAVDPNLARAYVAYQQGSLVEAENFYREALTVNPMQRDALLGLATIAAQNGDSAQALDLYSRMLARNPRDPIARAGLMEILPAGSPASQEADLKRLLSEYPTVAALAYAHGNFLASNQRWSEAQQAYFRALQLAKSDAAIGGRVNPDYAFNLAVSLEHLNQSEPAQNYYREALDFAANHPAGFDLTAVRSRLATMARSSSNE